MMPYLLAPTTAMQAERQQDAGEGQQRVVERHDDAVDPAAHDSR